MVTDLLGNYIKERKIAISNLAEKTGLKAQALYDSFDQEKPRQLRADEFMAICDFLEINPFDFYPQNNKSA